MTDLPKLYEPQAAQRDCLALWEMHGYYNADPQPDKPSHAIMIPLPNVTGALHMGHALNGTCQDLINRWRRMQGYEALWMPGTDHAGIATQAVVERRMLEEEGLTRHEIGREALVNRIWKWKDSYEGRILDQLKQMGASCDWRRVRFTLDDVCSKAVRRTFFKLFSDGLIYRGKRLVNWDTYLQTAVADDEVFDEEVDGHFWTFNYPVVDDQGTPVGRTISFSTTRPETMLGDTAVCVHPTDERYTELIGKQVQIPLNGRLIPIIADALLADKELGTGCVKVTPAHDPNDYQCGLRNDLPMINILNTDGTINEEGGEFTGLDRYAARDAVVAKMGELGHFEKVEDRKIPMKHSDRSKTPVEPYLSDQWFVRMDELAQSAIDAVQDGRVKFFPERYAKTYIDWLAEKRDWCISRQLWWGHRIPVWSKCFSAEDFQTSYPDGFQLDPAWDAAGSIQSVTATDDATGEQLVLLCVDADHVELEARVEAAGFEQDPDVLDTWFSSALWPHATLGWPDTAHNPPLSAEAVSAQTSVTPADASSDSGNQVLDYFYPTGVLITSRDIITLWVARMVLTGLYNMGDVPFRHVHVHPKILDGFGQTMSKSKGNGVDPMDLIDKYGADGMRFTIASIAGETQDVRLPVGYECPHCGHVIPQKIEHQTARPEGGPKPRIECDECKKSSQFSSAWFTPDDGEPVARVVSERFEYGRNFCNKLWNATRFAMMNLEGYAPGTVSPEDLELEDRWILSRLCTVADEVDENLSHYRFDAATRALRDFVWSEFCDWYLEMIKPRLRDEDRRPVAQRVLVTVLDTTLRLLHPFVPFITETLWQQLHDIAESRGLPEPAPVAAAIIVAPYPRPESLSDWRNADIETQFAELQNLIIGTRNIRAQYNIAPGASIRLLIKCDRDTAVRLQGLSAQFQNLAKAELVEVGPDVARPAASAGFVVDGAEGYIPLEGVIDLDAERKRQQKQADKLRGTISGVEKKLSNANFVDKAPPEVVAAARESLDSYRVQLAGIEATLAQLGE